jgi:hypothetical protein
MPALPLPAHRGDVSTSHYIESTAIGGKREGPNMKPLILAGCALLALSAPAHANSLPKTMLGNWCAVSESEDLYIRKACPNSDGKLTVRQNEYVFWESGCEIKRVQRQARGAYLVPGSCSGEGTDWTAKSKFELISDRLSIKHSLVAVNSHAQRA